MATKAEKTFGILLGFSLGYLMGEHKIESNKIAEADKWKVRLKYFFGGGLAGYTIAELVGSPNDTVNYQLFQGRKRVYHGIAYEDRVEPRRFEHKRAGKLFTRMVIDKPKPREEALKKEKELIKLHKPKYNIQHKHKTD